MTKAKYMNITNTFVRILRNRYDFFFIFRNALPFFLFLIWYLEVRCCRMFIRFVGVLFIIYSLHIFFSIYFSENNFRFLLVSFSISFVVLIPFVCSFYRFILILCFFFVSPVDFFFHSTIFSFLHAISMQSHFIFIYIFVCLLLLLLVWINYFRHRLRGHNRTCCFSFLLLFLHFFRQSYCQSETVPVHGFTYVYLHSIFCLPFSFFYSIRAFIALRFRLFCFCFQVHTHTR